MKTTTPHLGQKNRTGLKRSLIVPTLALALMAQAAAAPAHHRYKLIDLGTFGGPSSTFNSFSKTLNNHGTAVGGADTPIPDPFAPNCFSASCYVQHAFRWENGILTDLGTLPGGGSSWSEFINEAGQMVGRSQNGLIDPLTGIPATIAVVWQDGKILSLGTLGGNQSASIANNNRGQVIGIAANTIPDPFSLAGFGTQTRAFLWYNGVMRDLGTLGGPDSFGQYVNDRGQVVGFSYTDSIPNDTTGIPTQHPFLWGNGQMMDLCGLGGTLGDTSGVNQRGDVVGNMTLPGDEFQHPYLWSDGTLTDLGTFGGDNGMATGLNNTGEVCGQADLPDGSHNAFLWKKGVMTDLGNLGLTSSAQGINSKGQVVGGSRISFVPSEANAFLWEHGGPMIDLNTLIPANSSLHLSVARVINDRGEIMGVGTPPGVSFDDIDTLGHAFLLIPTGAE